MFVLIIVAKMGVYSIEIPTIPFLKHYPKSVYKAGTQNWQIIQSANDVIYFANNYGVLKFDGNHWQLKPIDNNSVVRSICEIGKDSILVGGYAEFGLIQTNKFGDMYYESWLDKVPQEHLGFREVWRIYSVDNKVFVQSFTHLLVFEDGIFKHCFRSQEQFKYMFKLNGRIYIQDLGVGVFLFSNKELKKLDEFDYYNDKEIWSLIPLNNNIILVGTQLNGVFIQENLKNSIWNSAANNFVKKNNLFCALKMSNDRLIFGTIQGGYIETDLQGNITSFVNKKSGLQNNTVLCLFEDRQKNIWIGLDNGIDYALLNAPLLIVKKRDGFGMGYASAMFNDKLYVGTNQGLYYIPVDEKTNKHSFNNDFKAFKEAQGQVWNLVVINNELFVCHNFGLFQIKDNKLIKLNVNAGVWNIKPFPLMPDLLLIGSYEGFYVYNKKSGVIKKIKGFDLPVRRFEFDSNNEVFLSHGYKGIYHLRIDLTSSTCVLVNQFDSKNGLPFNHGNDLFKLKDKLIVTTDSAVYSYSGKSFSKYPIWNSFFNNDVSGITSLNEIDENIYYCFKNGFLYKITWLNDNMFDVQNEQFALVSNTFPRGYENMLVLSESDYLFGNEHGFILYDSKKSYYKNNLIKLDLHKVHFVDKELNNQHVLSYTKTDGRYILDKLPYQKNKLIFSLSMPEYSSAIGIFHRYRLNNGPWSNWKSGHELHFNNLKEGHYVIQIECSKNKSEPDSQVSISLTIEPPLYRRWYSYLFYLFLFFASTLIASYLIKRKIAYEKRKESISQQRKTIENKIKLKQKAEHAQVELALMKNERLKTDIRHKSKELANTTMSIIQKNQMLQQIKDVLVKLGRNDIKYKENKEVGRLIKKINREIDNQDNWTVFERNFDKVHENFLIRIKETHNDLTPKDLRLAAYLRMNLASKEIAPLLNISVRSVEISRYRLRKKMNLEHDQNLTEYLINV